MIFFAGFFCCCCCRCCLERSTIINYLTVVGSKTISYNSAFLNKLSFEGFSRNLPALGAVNALVSLRIDSASSRSIRCSLMQYVPKSRVLANLTLVQ